jgi:DNA-binding MarR family transcriptional regulator
MEASGLVERQPDPNDRRARKLYTTEAGRALLEPMRDRAAAVYEQVQAGLSAEERAILQKGLRTVIANLSGAGAAADAEEPRSRQPAGVTA